ncbi:MAG: tetratricopeptide repeat protein [Kangiellaceae bacterium]
MNKIIICSALVFSFIVFNADAAKNTEVYDYDRASDLGNTAFKNKNYDNAFKHLDKASKLGNKAAQYSLALMYMGGLGVKQDYSQAYLWLNVAAEAKESKWRKLRDKIHSALSKEQRAALAPHVESYIEKYGAKTQEISCRKKAALGSNRKFMICTKHLDSGTMRL